MVSTAVSSAFFFLMIGVVSCSILTVRDGGVYSRITARISEDVPRQYCHQVIENLEVSHVCSFFYCAQRTHHRLA